MIFIKYIILTLIFAITSILGFVIANRYKFRVRDLKLLRNVLNVLETKIKYTYEPLPKIFEDLSREFDYGISQIFAISKEKMKTSSASEALEYGINKSETYLNKEDLEILRNLEKLLGKTNVEGQLSEINLSKKFVDMQIQKAEEEQRKNEKLYRNLGIILGIVMVIIFI